MPADPAPLAVQSTADTVAAPTHPCVRCGKPTAIDRGLCEECNPLGLRDASASQVHGVALVGVIVAIVVLAVLGRIAISGIGPFEASVGDVQPAVSGLSVTLEVTNTGSSAGQTTCRITDPSTTGTTAVAVVQSPRIDPGETRSFTSEVTQFGSEPLALAVSCDTP
jgi:hypothetical protein